MAATDLFPRGLIGLTLGQGLRAARMKTTARWGIERIGHLARQDHALSLQRRVLGECCRQIMGNHDVRKLQTFLQAFK
jgi:hypothetical protein